MSQTRKDLRGRVLRKGESQRRSDGRYVYTYTDPLGRRKYVYAQDLVTLREKEAQLMKDQMDGLDIYVAGFFSAQLDLSKVKIEPFFEEYVDFDTFAKSDFRVVNSRFCTNLSGISVELCEDM